VAEIPLHTQAKLLRVLEAREFQRVGGEGSLTSNFRLICATHKNLEDLVRAGRFREDLYYRLVGVALHLPPLRERPEDIPELVQQMIKRLKSGKTFSDAAVRQMQFYPWPGNIRQLMRVVEAVDALCPHEEIQPEDLPPPLRPAIGATGAAAPTGFPPLDSVVSQAEKEHIRLALAMCSGNKERARELLGISRDTLWNRLKVYGLL
jgi:DNA-binding NtrC family response regulator